MKTLLWVQTGEKIYLTFSKLITLHIFAVFASVYGGLHDTALHTIEMEKKYKWDVFANTNILPFSSRAAVILTDDALSL